jgi:hypothetical protein
MHGIQDFTSSIETKNSKNIIKMPSELN